MQLLPTQLTFCTLGWHRYSAVITPVINFVMEALPEASRDTKHMELAYEDFEKLSAEEVLRICEWLTDKVRPVKMCGCVAQSGSHPAENPLVAKNTSRLLLIFLPRIACCREFLINRSLIRTLNVSLGGWILCADQAGAQGH